MHVSIYTYCICISERVLHWIGVHLLTFLFFPRGFVVSSKSNNGVDCVLWSKQVVGSGKFISFGYLHLVGYIYIYYFPGSARRGDCLVVKQCQT